MEKKYKFKNPINYLLYFRFDKVSLPKSNIDADKYIEEHNKSNNGKFFKNNLQQSFKQQKLQELYQKILIPKNKFQRTENDQSHEIK